MEKIDLHGIKHEDVVKTMDDFLWEMMQKYKWSTLEVEVITGISDRMKEIVRDVCQDYNFKVSEHPTNIGCLIVKVN